MRRGVWFALALGAATATAEPVLGPGDEVALRAPDRPELSGAYLIGPDRGFVLPGVGRVGIGSGRFDDLRAGVRAAMTAAGLADRPFGLTLARARPVVVDGAVARPGEYPYFIGVTAAHAIALAGGARRRLAESRIEAVEIGRETERLLTARDSLAEALIGAARAEAELAESVAFDAPAEAVSLVGTARAAALTAQARRESEQALRDFNLALEQFANARRINEAEIVAQSATREAQREQLALLREEEAKLAPLAARGNVTGGRMLTLRRAVAGSVGLVAEAGGALAKARLAASSSDNESRRLTSARRAELTARLGALRSAIHRGRLSVAEIEASLDAAAAPRPAPDSSGALCQLGVLRPGATAARDVEPATELQPGDLLIVRRFSAACALTARGDAP